MSILLSELKERQLSGNRPITDRDLIKKSIAQMRELTLDGELYKDGAVDRDDYISQIRSLCFFDREKTLTLGALLQELARFRSYTEAIDDDEAFAAEERGDFCLAYDPDCPNAASPRDVYKEECLWSYYEALHLLSYIHMGFCIDTLNKE